MPIYEYICMACNEKFSLLQRINAEEQDAECPKCAARQVKKVMSSFCCSSGSDAGYSSTGPSRGGGGGG